MDKANGKDKGTEGPGVKFNANKTGDYKRGLNDKFKGNVEAEKRKGAGAKQ